MRTLARHALLLPGLVFLLAFFVVPSLLLLQASFRVTDQFGNMLNAWTTAHYVLAFTQPYFSGAIAQSLWLSLEVTATCAVLGYIAAHAIVHTKSRVLKPVLYAIVISPLLTSVVARSFGWIVLLSRTGVINGMLLKLGLIDAPLRLLYNAPSTVVAVSQVLMPFAVLPVVSAFASVGADVEKASAILGASKLRTFRRVTLPLVMRGVVVGALLVFAHAMGIYITPLLVGGPSRPLMSVRIYEQALSFYNVSQAAALSFVLVVITLGVVILASITFGAWSRKRLA